MNERLTQIMAGRRRFFKVLLLGVALCATAWSVVAATGMYSSIVLVRAVRVDSTHYDLYARPGGQYQSVQFETLGHWAVPGIRLSDGTWKVSKIFGHPGAGWGARTIVNGRPDAAAFGTLP